MLNSIKSNFLEHKLDVFLFSLLFLITLIIWLPSINQPYWWDSANYSLPNSLLFLKTNFWPLITLHSDFSHPPLFNILLAIAWKLTGGESLFVSHLLDLFFTSLLVYFLLKVGQTIGGEDKSKLIGFMAALLFLFTPLVAAQIGIVYLEIPVTAFCVAAYYYFLKQNISKLVIFSTLAVLTKEIALISISIFILLQLIQESKKTNKKHLFLYSIPYLAYITWLFYHWLFTHWLLVKPDTNFANFAFIPSLFFKDLLLICYLFLVSQGRLLITTPLIILVIYFLRKQKLKFFTDFKIISLYLVPALYIVFFAYTTFLERYLIIPLVFFYLCYSYLLVTFFSKFKHSSKRIAISVIMLISIFSFYSYWDLHRQITTWSFAPLEENLEYRDVIAIGIDTAKFIEKNYPTSTVYTSFPIDYMLQQPEEHYVSSPIQIKECKDFKQPSREDLVIFTYFSPGEKDCLVLMKKANTSMIKTFSRNGKTITISKLDSPK